MTLRGRKGVRVIGDHGPLLKFTPGSGLCLVDCQDCEISGLTFQGSGYTLTPEKWYFALMLLAGTNARLHIHDCSLWDSGNHGIGHLMSGSTDDSLFDRNIFLRGGHLNRPADIPGQDPLGGDGAALAVRGSRNVYRHNLIIDWLRGIEIEAKTNEASGNIIEHNELRNIFWHGIFITPTSMDSSTSRRNIIRRNRITTGPGMGNFTMAHPIYVSGGYDHTIEENEIYGSEAQSSGKAKDWCGIDCSANHCDLTAIIRGNKVFGIGRFGIGLGFNDKPAGILRADVSGNQLDYCGGAGIGYRQRNNYRHRIWSNHIGAVVPRDGVEVPIYAPDDPMLTCCWDNRT